MEPSSDIRLLFHKLNNQLGIILSHAELLEAKATDPMNRSRAALVVSSVLDAMGTTKELRSKIATVSAGVPDTDATIATS